MDDRPATRPIAEIIVGERHRRNLGDIAGFARRIEELGLMHPIVIRPDGRLIAGERRLEAYKLLGRDRDPGDGRRPRGDRARRAGRERRPQGLFAERDRGDSPDAGAAREGGGNLPKTFRKVGRVRQAIPATRSAPSPASPAAPSRRLPPSSRRPRLNPSDSPSSPRTWIAPAASMGRSSASRWRDRPRASGRNRRRCRSAALIG